MDFLSGTKGFTDFNFLLSVDDILHGQGADPQIVHKRKPLLVKAAEKAHAEGVNLLHPVALTQEIGVKAHHHEHILLEGGMSLTGPLVAGKLLGAQQVVAAVCTIGPELEESVGRLLQENPLYAMALDGLGNAAVENLAQQVCAAIEAEIHSEGCQVSTPLSPGSPDWPVEIGQPQIFGLVDPAHAGIHLTSAGMMFPKKSISFVVGIGPEMSQTDPCELCSLKETCRFGHA